MHEIANQEQDIRSQGDPSPELLHLLSVASAKLNALISDPSSLTGNQNRELLNEVQQIILAAQRQAQVYDAARLAGRADDSQNILDALMSYIPEGITIADAPDVIIRMVSKYGQELTGRSIEAIVDIPMQEHPENWQIYYLDDETLVPPEMLPLSRATLLGEIVENEELLLKRGSGEWIYVSCSAGPIRDNMGNITGGVIAWRNITTQKQAEQALQDRNARLALLSEAASELLRGDDPLALLDGVYQRLAALLGLEVYVHYLRAEEGNHLELAAISGIPEKARQHLERLELGQAVCGTVALTHQAMVVEDVQKSTDPRTALIRSLGITVYACHPLIVQDRLVGTLSFGSRSRTNFDPPSLSLIRTVCDLVANAIDRKKSEQALQESEARFRSVIENSLDIAYRRNQKMDRYDYMSPVVMQVLGFSEDEMNAMGMDELLERIHPDDRQTITAQLAKANETGRSKLEYRFKNKDGQYRWLADYVTVTKDLDEQPLYRIGIVRDITHIKRVENELRSLNRGLEQRVAERTEELLEMQRRLMDGIEAERIQLAREIHDGPMQDIYALSYRIAGVDRTLPTENIENELASIQKGLLQINQTLRAISQDLLPPTLSQFGLEKSIREHIANIQQAHPELKINLDLLRDGKSLEERVRLALFRIYQTSITNVIRHAQARQVDIRFYSETEQYCLEIQDDGIGFGIPKSWIGFARKGHMGLVSAQERAQSVGGKMEVQSQPGKGTLLRVLVPRS